ncbi:hypothetical protein F511_38476 [Dorcoceras hygrometricum]|uniref:Uncharacterized protein n=1 Tax=Dorcoceras hygrometricum TaxID=472368 RepID=A0A2Z7D078_9LAMI|nr:hypothetical protein F511_38476 [Dorcoceras hygrometricum]
MYDEVMDPYDHDMVKWQHRGVRDPEETLSRARKKNTKSYSTNSSTLPSSFVVAAAACRRRYLFRPSRRGDFVREIFVGFLVQTGEGVEILVVDWIRRRSSRSTVEELVGARRLDAIKSNQLGSFLSDSVVSRNKVILCGISVIQAAEQILANASGRISLEGFDLYNSCTNPLLRPAAKRTPSNQRYTDPHPGSYYNYSSTFTTHRPATWFVLQQFMNSGGCAILALNSRDPQPRELLATNDTQTRILDRITTIPVLLRHTDPQPGSYYNSL